MLVEPAPLQPLHLLLNIPEHARNPVDHAVEVGLQLIDVVFVAMAAHVAANIALAHPVQRPLQEVLPVCAALDVRAPFLDVRVLAVAELGLGKRHERPGVDGVQELLGVERHACDVDSLKPLLDLGLRALALVDQQFRVPNLGLLVGGQAVEVLRIAVIHDRELVRNEPSDTGDALLAVQHLELVLRDFVEVDQPERIPLEQRVDDRLPLSCRRHPHRCSSAGTPAEW